MSRRINFQDIQAGDVIEVIERRRITVEGVNTLAGALEFSNGKTVKAQPEPRRTPDVWGREFKLIERPALSLPTGIGSVILVNSRRYFLRHSEAYSDGLWQGTKYSGDIKSSIEMMGLVKKNGGFEVLL